MDKPDLQPFEEEPAITLTGAAADRIGKLLKERNLPDHALRVFVSGGGCSGMQYGMALEGEPREYDAIFEQGGVRVVIDPTSMQYISGAVVDYVDNIMGGGFKIDNPNAVASCGCGHSFRTAGSPAAASGGGCGCGN
ncbi:MAG: iron-sulfur cluster insertion protein ErpA [Chloroflexi bacterium]|nr:iron-sulfur cluster insertion protein ErpA [Chloroflexota bacterium]